MNENELLEALKAGDEPAFAFLVKTYEQMVYNTVLNMIQSVEDAEDVSQEVFMQAFQSVKSFKGASRISTWLYRIAITKSLDRIKYRQRKKRFGFITALFGGEGRLDEQPATFFHPSLQLENKERASILFKAISELPDNQRIAFTLNKTEGLGQKEIAEIMGITVGAVESYLQRAKQNLRKKLSFYYENK